jgi:lipoprotein-releasing system permease protein
MKLNKTVIFIVIRYFTSLTRSSFSGFLAWVSIISCMLGVLSLVTVLNLMNGFEMILTNRILVNDSHITIQVEEDNIEEAKLFLSDARSSSYVINSTFYASAVALANIGSQITPVKIKSLFIPNQNYLDSPPSIGVTIDASFSFNYSLNIEDEFIFYTINKDNIFNSPRDFLVQVENIIPRSSDGNLPIIYINNLVSAIEKGEIDNYEIDLWVTKPKDLKRLSDLVSGYFIDSHVSFWPDKNASLFNAIKIEKLFMSLLILLIIFVSMFNLYASLSHLFNKKKLDFCILKTIGMNQLEINKIMFFYPLLIVSIGIFFGLFIGTILSLNLDSIALYLYKNFGDGIFSFELFYLSQVPALVSITQYLIIISIVLFMAYVTTSIFIKRHMNITISDHFKGKGI